MNATYNGWKNRQTWNVALWIGNDEGLYNAAVEFVRQSKTKRALYRLFIESQGMASDRTPDGIKWLGLQLDLRALNEMMRELAGE